ncbi:MAG: right-handed parallel beta-helix repeat-containing protein [Mycobacteriales bacterium]
MAAYPDQVWIDGSVQHQVGSVAQVRPGTFYVDTTHDRLYVGTNPVARHVRASTLQRALSVQVAGSVIRGIGIGRYAPSVPDVGAITLERASITMENDFITQISTAGVKVIADNITLRGVTVTYCGLLGIGGNEAYDMTLRSVNSSHNNIEHFNTAPVSGGLKITRSRGILIRDSTFSYNAGPGIWLDECTYDSKIIRNRVFDNAVHGIALENSAKSTVADNRVLGNGRDGVKINNTNGVSVWNNSFAGNGRTVDMAQDKRVQTSRTPRDSRRPFPDPTMTWRLGHVTASNNVIARQNRSGTCMICVEDGTHTRTAAQFDIHVSGNVYQRLGDEPAWLVVWANGPGNPKTYSNLRAFRSATGQESTGRLFETAGAVRADGTLSPSVSALRTSIGHPLPAVIAQLLGHPNGVVHLGAWTT